MFKLDMFDVACVLCLAAYIHNEVKNYREVKFMENQPKPNWEEINNAEEFYDRRRKVILVASIGTAATALAWRLHNNKK